MGDEVVIIYADVLFLISFAVDFLCLLLSGRLVSLPPKALRLIGGAALGGVYSFADFWMAELPQYVVIPIHFAAAVLICAVAYKTRTFKGLLRVSAVFILTCAVLGGIVSALFSLSERFGGVPSGALPFIVAILLAATAAGIYAALHKKKQNIHSIRAEITVRERVIPVNLLVDSGNLVTEPFSGLPVIVLSAAVLPAELGTPSLEREGAVPWRAIPIRTSAGSGLLYGLIPDEVLLCPFFEKKRPVNAAIGIDLENAAFAAFDGLLPACLLQKSASL